MGIRAGNDTHNYTVNMWLPVKQGLVLGLIIAGVGGASASVTAHLLEQLTQYVGQYAVDHAPDKGGHCNGGRGPQRQPHFSID